MHEEGMRIRKLDMDTPMDVVFTNGQYGIYDDARYEPAEGLHMYQCRDCGKEYIGEIKEGILADFSGTIFTKKPLDEALQYYPGSWEGFYDSRPTDGFCGFRLTPRQFIGMTEEQIEKLDR